ncbi:hypothetical protein NDU88_003392 [Pleurodeles waltl]|uniref:Uncharacterized protein n=1 Tax=Pleurodeles waltl TaxID=8319 RepID=A0AAV7MS34_PLEWA|nr:hypothetical protein NDU88_003392 [Pleurodeles waltl]
MAKSPTTYETTPPAPVQRGKEAKPVNIDQGPLDTAENFFSLSDQSRDSDLDEEIPLTDSDIESSSAASIWVSNYSTCRRKSVEQTDVRSSSGAKLRRDPLKPQEEDGEMQWDYTATQQAFSKSDSACSTLVPPSMGGPEEPPSLDLIYRTMVQNHEQAQRESRKMKAANRQLQLSIQKWANLARTLVHASPPWRLELRSWKSKLKQQQHRQRHKDSRSRIFNGNWKMRKTASGGIT